MIMQMVRPSQFKEVTKVQGPLTTFDNPGVLNELPSQFTLPVTLDVHRPPLPRLHRRQSTLTTLLNPRYHPPHRLVPAATTHNPNAPNNINFNIVNASDVDLVYTCPHCDRIFPSHIGLVGHLRIHRKELGEPVPGAPIYTCRTHQNCPHCLRTFNHRMGLFGHMRIHEGGIDHNIDTPSTSCTPTLPSSTHVLSSSVSTINS
nr:unnamed protein product [Spirometra erinaceieuropaei]